LKRERTKLGQTGEDMEIRWGEVISRIRVFVKVKNTAVRGRGGKRQRVVYPY